MSKITAATINRELKARGIAERVKQGRGYVYFVDGDASSWHSSSIPVCYLWELITQGNLAKTVDDIADYREYLRNL